MEAVLEVAQEENGSAEVIAEVEKFRDIHEERVAVGAGQYYFDEKANDYVIKDDFGNPKYRNEIITEEILKDDKNLGEKSPFGKNFEEWIKNNHDPVKTVSVEGKNILPESIKFSDISAFVKGLVKKGEFYKGKVKNEYSGFEIHIGANGLNETARNAQLQKNKASAEALKNIKELVENAVLIGAHDVDVSQKKVSKKNKPQRLYQYIFACPYIKNGTENVAIIRADRIYDGDNTIRNFYNLKSIETVATNPEFRLSRPAGNAATIYSIADLANVVNEQYLGYRSSYEYQKKNIFDTKIIDKILGIESNPELNTPPSIGNTVFGPEIFRKQEDAFEEGRAEGISYEEYSALEDTVPSFVRADIDRVINDPSIDNEQKFVELAALYDRAATPAEKAEIGRQIYLLRSGKTKPAFNEKEAERVSAEVAESAKRVAQHVAERIKAKREQAAETSGKAEETPAETEEGGELVEVAQSDKSRRYERRVLRRVEEGIASVFGIERADLKGDIRPLVEKAAADIKDGKKKKRRSDDRRGFWLSGNYLQTLLSTSSWSFAMKSSRATAPRSPSFLERTATLPSSISFAPTTSM